jgi:tRNA-Thr(GGU) m(6)t(6)A37 methyltransferase TsaA
MKRIITQHLEIFPLSTQQLGDFLKNPDKLEQELGFPISRLIIDENVERAINTKLAHLDNIPEMHHIWRTYWLIQIREPAFGAGLAGFKGHPDKNNSTEIGYGIDPEFRNKGIMSEAISALTEWALSQPECRRVTATHVIHPASNRLLEKIGYSFIEETPQGSTWYRERLQISDQTNVYTFSPIGIIHSPHMEPSGTPIQPKAAANSTGFIDIFPQYQTGLQDLDGFSHIILLYAFHRAAPSQLIVQPFLDSNQHGIFATRAPARPNPIGLSVVRLNSVEGSRLHISGVDMLDQTPLLDIKPFVPQFDSPMVDRLGWLEQNINGIQITRDDGRFAQKP